jgi:predicted outer membrane repeat protein
VLLQDSILTSNYVLSRGGAVAVKANATAILRGCLLTSNTVKDVDGKGGAVYTEGLTLLSNTWIDNNAAYIGGGILLAPGSTLELGGNVSVTNNTARKNGGGVAIESQTAKANFKALRAITRWVLSLTSDSMA